MKRRKGSIALVLMFGMSMAYVNVHHLTVAANLYQLQRSSSDVYASIQSYRSIAEIAAAQFVSDMCSVQIIRDLDAEWLNVRPLARYYEALDDIRESFESETERGIWEQTDIEELLLGVACSDPSVTYRIAHELSGDNKEFKLRIPTDFELDWDSEKIVSRSGYAQIPLKPLEIEVYLRVKNEEILEVFAIEGLFLEMTASTLDVGGSEHDSIVFKLSEDSEVFNIWRTHHETS